MKRFCFNTVTELGIRIIIENRVSITLHLMSESDIQGHFKPCISQDLPTFIAIGRKKRTKGAADAASV